MNLLKETLEILEENGKSPVDVRWVGASENDIWRDKPQNPTSFGSWDDFEGLANFDYDDGYGGAEINVNLVVVGDNWWLERGEYDGSEWWNFKTLPQKPDNHAPLQEKYLKNDWR